MDLKEHEGRSLFAKYGIPVPRGFLLRGGSKTKGSARAKAQLGAFLKGAPDVNELALKSQPLSGKRGKAGGIVFTDKRDFAKELAALRKKTINGEKVDSVLAVERLAVKKEYYLAVTLDRHKRMPVMVFSDLGGVDIEETAAKNPARIKKIPITDLRNFPGKETEKLAKKFFTLPVGAGGRGKSGGAHAAGAHAAGAEEMFSEIARNLYRLFVSEDCLLAEINPLILTRDGRLVAADAKLTLDDSSLYRHPRRLRLRNRQRSRLESEAAEFGLSYVELEGNLAVIGNGAGLVMSTLDAVKHFGAEPANFCDLGGGASQTMMEKAMETVLKKRAVKAVFINVFGGITRCDEVARGLVAFIRSKKPAKKIPPMVVRLVGTNQEAGVRILRKAGTKAFTRFEEAAAAAAKLTRN